MSQSAVLLQKAFIHQYNQENLDKIRSIDETLDKYGVSHAKFADLIMHDLKQQLEIFNERLASLKTEEDAKKIPEEIAKELTCDKYKKLIQDIESRKALLEGQRSEMSLDEQVRDAQIALFTEIYGFMKTLNKLEKDSPSILDDKAMMQRAFLVRELLKYYIPESQGLIDAINSRILSKRVMPISNKNSFIDLWNHFYNSQPLIKDINNNWWSSFIQSSTTIDQDNNKKSFILQSYIGAETLKTYRTKENDLTVTAKTQKESEIRSQAPSTLSQVCAPGLSEGKASVDFEDKDGKVERLHTKCIQFMEELKKAKQKIDVIEYRKLFIEATQLYKKLKANLLANHATIELILKKAEKGLGEQLELQERFAVEISGLVTAVIKGSDEYYEFLKNTLQVDTVEAKHLESARAKFGAVNTMVKALSPEKNKDDYYTALYHLNKAEEACRKKCLENLNDLKPTKDLITKIQALNSDFIEENIKQALIANAYEAKKTLETQCPDRPSDLKALNSWHTQKFHPWYASQKKTIENMKKLQEDYNKLEKKVQLLQPYQEECDAIKKFIQQVNNEILRIKKKLPAKEHVNNPRIDTLNSIVKNFRAINARYIQEMQSVLAQPDDLNNVKLVEIRNTFHASIQQSIKDNIIKKAGVLANAGFFGRIKQSLQEKASKKSKDDDVSFMQGRGSSKTSELLSKELFLLQSKMKDTPPPAHKNSLSK